MPVYKKVLIVSHNVFSTKFNNGITLNNLFQYWPDDKLCQLFFNRATDHVDRDIDFIQLNVANLIRNFFRSGLFTMKPTLVDDGLPSSSTWKSTTNPFIRILMRDLIYVFLFRVSGSIKAKLDIFKPDTIFVLAGGSLLSLYTAFLVSRFYNIPFSIYITDNYLYDNNDSGFLKRRMGCYVDKIYRFYFARAKTIFVISRELGERFNSLYRVDYQILINPGLDYPLPDESQFSMVSKSGQGIIIGYFGGLHFSRCQSIVALAERLQDWRPNSVIRVYSHSKANVDPVPQNLSFHSAVYGASLMNAIESCDVLLHVESFDPTIFDDIRYSISTKIPEAMSLRKPLIAVGPSKASSIALIKENDLGIVLDEEFFQSSERPSLDAFGPMLSADKLAYYSDRSYRYWQSNYSPAVLNRTLLNSL